MEQNTQPHTPPAQTLAKCTYSTVTHICTHTHILTYILYVSHIILKDRTPHCEEPSRKRAKLSRERIYNSKC